MKRERKSYGDNTATIPRGIRQEQDRDYRRSPLFGLGGERRLAQHARSTSFMVCQTTSKLRIRTNRTIEGGIFTNKIVPHIVYLYVLAWHFALNQSPRGQIESPRIRFSGQCYELWLEDRGHRETRQRHVDFLMVDYKLPAPLQSYHSALKPIFRPPDWIVFKFNHIKWKNTSSLNRQKQRKGWLKTSGIWITRLWRSTNSTSTNF